jgi:hypothetical protein
LLEHAADIDQTSMQCQAKDKHNNHIHSC